jgi:hypothetical protein
LAMLMARSRLSTLEGCAGNTLLQQQMNKQQSKALLERPAKSAVMKILMYFNVSGWVDSRTCPVQNSNRAEKSIPLPLASHTAEQRNRGQDEGVKRWNESLG